jgi:hypothetical protein
MEKIIYKFLDYYLGDEVSYEKGITIYNPHTFDRGIRYHIYSKKNNTLILLFTNYTERSDINYGDYLTGTVSRFFSMDTVNTTKVIKNWFMDKHNLKEVSDILSSISE